MENKHNCKVARVIKPCKYQKTKRLCEPVDEPFGLVEKCKVCNLKDVVL